MRIDLHTHSLMSDGELLPIELSRRAKVLGHEAIAITDHVDHSNLERVIASVSEIVEAASEWLDVIVGVELTHIPASRIGELARRAKALGAEWIVVHGETLVEPVEQGTNLAALQVPEVDMLAHPGLISRKEAQMAADNGILLELTSRRGHSLSNGHVASMARECGAELVVNTDTHAPGDLIDEEMAIRVAMGAGLERAEAERAVRETPLRVLRRLR
jgi:putative hydrolase